MQDTRLLAYSADRSIPSLSRNGVTVCLNREEALQHAFYYRGMRSQSNGVLVEIAGVYVEGDNEAGVVMGVWQFVKEG